MAIPKRDEKTKECTVTMMELRRQPGEVFDFVLAGGTVHVTRQGKPVATIVPHESSFWEKFKEIRPSLLKGGTYE